MSKHLDNSILLFSDRIEIKPLSVNECWQGKRFKTKAYTAYEKELLYRLSPADFDKSKDYNETYRKLSKVRSLSRKERKTRM